MDTKQVAEILQATPHTIRVLLQNIDPELHSWKPEPNEWSINEIIGHLIEADRHAFADRIQLMLDENEPEIPGVDVNALAAQRDDNQRDALSLLDELAEHRIEHSQLVLSLSADQLARAGNYAKRGRFLVSDFVYEWSYHDCAHVQQILEVIKSATWPHLSQTMQTALGN